MDGSEGGREEERREGEKVMEGEKEEGREGEKREMIDIW